MRTSPLVALLAAVLALGCGEEATGVHVTAHLASVDYDELRFGVTSEDAAATFVDPATRGRYMGPFSAGDQDVVIYLADDLAGQIVRCQVTALAAGAIRASGNVDVTLARAEIKDVEVFMAAPATTPPTTTPPPGGSSGPGGGDDQGDNSDLCKGPDKPKCTGGTKCVLGLCV